MMKILILVIAITITYNRCHAQLSIGVNIGLNFNHLSTDISNRLFTKNTNEIGYSTNLLLIYPISDIFNIQTGIGMMQKNYSFVRTGYYEGTYEKFTNAYLQVPLMTQFRVLQMHSFKVFFNLGIYGAYWALAKVDGSLPNIYNSTNEVDNAGQITQYFAFTKYSEKYQFNQTKDNRFEYGWISGIDFNYDLTAKYSIFLKTSYYQSQSDKQKKYMVDQIINANQTFCISIGYLMKFL